MRSLCGSLIVCGVVVALLTSGFCTPALAQSGPPYLPAYEADTVPQDPPWSTVEYNPAYGYFGAQDGIFTLAKTQTGYTPVLFAMYGTLDIESDVGVTISLRMRFTEFTSNGSPFVIYLTDEDGYFVFLWIYPDHIAQLYQGDTAPRTSASFCSSVEEGLNVWREWEITFKERHLTVHLDGDSDALLDIPITGTYGPPHRRQLYFLMSGNTPTLGNGPSTVEIDYLRVTHPVTDAEPPVVTITSPSDGAVVGDLQVAVEGTVTDVTPTTVTSTPPGVTASLDAGGGSFSGTVPLAVEGNNQISVNATDSAGNVGGTSITVYRDTTPPAVVVLSPPDGAVVGGVPVRISVEASDETDMIVDIGGVIQSAEAGTRLLSADLDLVEGPNPIPVVVTDEGGNVTTLEHTVVVDTTAPVLTIDAPLDGTVYGPGDSPVPVTVTVDDLSAVQVTSEPSGVSELVEPGGGPATGAVDLHEGANTVTVSGTDAAGNTSSSSVVVILDTTAPVVAIESPGAGDAVRGTVDWHATVVDESPGSGVDQVDFLVDGAGHATLHEGPFEIDLDTLTLAEGNHTLTVEAVDGKGNSSSASIVVLVDNTGPEVVISAPIDGSYVAGTFPFLVDFSDSGSGVASVEMLVAGGAPTVDESSVFEPPVPAGSLQSEEDSTLRADGPLTLTATVVDAAGNQSSDSVTVTVDNNAPTGCVVQPADGSTVSGEILLVAEVQEPNLDYVEILVDGVSVGTSITSPFVVAYDTTGRLDGEMDVTASALDLAGNSTECSVTVTVDNMLLRLVPRTLNLKSKGQNCVHVDVEGPNVSLLDPLEQSGLELRVPGGNSVNARFDCGPQGSDPDVRKVSFSRQELIASIRAGIGAGEIDGETVTVTLVAGTSELGQDTIRIKGN